MQFTKWLLALCLLPAFANAQSDHDALNQIYQEFSDAYHELDVDALKQHYHADAQMLRVSDKKPLVAGRQDILNAYNHWFAKVDERDAIIEIRFRCSNRQLNSSVAIDSGYYLMRYSPPKDSGEQPSQFGGKYLFTFTKDDKGHWSIAADASNRVKQEMFIRAEQVEGLVYDAPFNPSKPTDSP